jgi:hypothetical protein
VKYQREMKDITNRKKGLSGIFKTFRKKMIWGAQSLCPGLHWLLEHNLQIFNSSLNSSAEDSSAAEQMWS